MKSVAALLLIAALTGPACAATDPAETIRSSGDGWIAIEFPAIEGTASPCCWQGRLQGRGEFGCSLEQDHYSYGIPSDAPLEDTIVAYTRVREGMVAQLKVIGRQCPMDAGGESITWLGSSDDHTLLDWLETLARNGKQRDVSHSALWALSLHASDSAGDRLYTLARDENEELAEEAIFWLGEARGQAGYEALEDLLGQLPLGETRRHINFALSRNSSDESFTLLARIARDDRDPEQRGEALFWMAQEYPAEAHKHILEVIEDEDDHEILEKAVFALSQLPSDTAGPALLDIAKDDSMPREARRQALFWLAHEGDEDSIAALTEMLTR